MKDKKKLIVKCMCAGMLAFIIAWLIVSHIGKIHVRDSVYYANQFAVQDYTIENGDYRVTGKSPQLVCRAIDRYVDKAAIYLAKPAEEDFQVTVYYVENDGAFTINNKKIVQINQGETMAEAMIGQNVWSLRVDIEGEQPDASFQFAYTILSNDLFAPLKGIHGDRFRIIFFVIFFILLHLIFPVKTMYEKIFKWRWGIACILLLYMVVNQYHFSSIGVYANTVQVGEGSEYMYPVFGESRPMRSDEWCHETPRILSAKYNDFAKYNEIIMATSTPNLAATGLHKSYAALALPERWLYYFLGNEYGISFQWNFAFFTAFMCTFELMLILTKRKKLLSLTGTCLIVFSAFFQWWSFSTVIWTTSMFLVCVWYFFHSDRWWKRLFFAMTTAIAAARYVIILYPALQVPMGYFILIMFVWMWMQSKNERGQFKKQDWLMLAFSVVFSCSLIAAYLYDITDYIEAISDTVYPGKRISCGGMALYRLFSYIQEIKYPIYGGINECENSVFLNFFPLALIGVLYGVIKNKKKDFLKIALLVYSGILTLYCSVGLPKIFCKLTLLSSCTELRAVAVLAYIQIFFLIYLLQEEEFPRKMPLWMGILCAILGTGLAIYEVQKYYPDYNSGAYLFVAGIVNILYGIVILVKVKKRVWLNVACGGLIVVSVAAGVRVNPLMKGLDAIYSKPIVQEIQKIVADEPDAVWISTSPYPGFLVACGAKTLNGNNYMPNLKFWELLKGEAGVTPRNFNRYANVKVTVDNRPTKLTLTYVDTLLLRLNYADLEKLNISYILSSDESEFDECENAIQIYNENGYYIYKVQRGK